MKIDDLLKLLDAGFSKNDIFTLLGQQNEAPVQDAQQEATEQQAQEAQPAKDAQQAAPAKEAQQAAPVDDKRLKDIETKLNYVVDRFNYMAVQQSKQPEQDKKETIEDILSNFVK